MPLPPPYPLKEVKVPIVENSLCDQKYHAGLYTGDNIRIVRDDMLCAGSPGSGICQVGPVSSLVPHPMQSPYGVLAPVFPRVTQGGRWSAKSRVPGCKQVWSAGVRAVQIPTILASTPG